MQVTMRLVGKRKIGYIVGCLTVLILVVSYLFYNYYEVVVHYDANMMKCNIDGDTLIFESIGQSVVNYDYITKTVDEENSWPRELARIVPDIRDVDERSRSRMKYKLY